MANVVTATLLDGWVGKGVSDFCDNDFSSPLQNHCAHFVSHVLGLTFGLCCGSMTSRRTSAGTSLRVNEIFNVLAHRGQWAEAPATTDGLLVFVTSAVNVRNNIMANVPRKHVGIVFSGAVYNFGNTQHMVRKDISLEAFRVRLGRTYHDDAIPLFYGVPQ